MDIIKYQSLSKGKSFHPLMVDLPPMRGWVYGWKRVDCFRFVEGKYEIDDMELIRQGYMPLSPHLLPLMPTKNGRIEYEGLVLCVKPEDIKLPEKSIEYNNIEKYMGTAVRVEEIAKIE